MKRKAHEAHKEEVGGNVEQSASGKNLLVDSHHHSITHPTKHERTFTMAGANQQNKKLPRLLSPTDLRPIALETSMKMNDKKVLL